VDPWEIYWVHFNGSRAADFARYLDTPTDRPVLFVPHPAALTEAFERAYHWLEHGFSDASLLALSSGLSEILSLVNMYRRAESMRARDAEERVIRSISFMRENLHRPHALKDLAGTAHLSVPHYSSLFKRYTGTSPVQFLIRLRVQKACELLDNTRQPIQEIGSRVGYEDPFYFSRLFTKVTGTSPSEYRRTVKG
jgi:AraC-like DNA-binding protein